MGMLAHPARLDGRWELLGAGIIKEKEGTDLRAQPPVGQNRAHGKTIPNPVGFRFPVNGVDLLPRTHDVLQPAPLYMIWLVCPAFLDIQPVHEQAYLCLMALSGRKSISGIPRETLLLSYEVATENTPLQGSKLVIQDVPVVLYCPHCQTSRQVAMIQRFCCPECGTPTREVRQGNELELASLEVETIPPRS